MRGTAWHASVSVASRTGPDARISAFHHVLLPTVVYNGSDASRNFYRLK